jgi:cytochrome c oxidase subunit III
MKRDFSKELEPEVREGMKKNLLYVGMFSIFMMFAGFSSAYYVSMGDSFWLKYPMPINFWISTVIIVLSSVFIHFAFVSAKKENYKLSKFLVLATFLCGVLFAVHQIKGYKELISEGKHPVNNHIIVTEGRYGDYFLAKFKGNFIEVEGNDYLVKGQKMNAKDYKAFQNFMQQFTNFDQSKKPSILNYGKDFQLYFKNQPLACINGELTNVAGKKLGFTELFRLNQLANNVLADRGDFYVKGEIGKDFNIYFKNEALTYKDRNLYYKNKILSKYFQVKAMETADTATSYLFLITILHLLHILLTLIYMFKMVIYSFTGRFESGDILSLKLGGIFWHFLGLLWVYLLLFFLFIH